ncbi:MAG TPA: SAP domain-containing protein, partial [Pyrinomonadaceae bacterium]|nr:SAP domain-containing protein [Pyrinomonadaceae bacterium]
MSERLNAPHLFFLISFLNPRPIDKDPDMPEWWPFPDWAKALGESPGDVLKSFIKAGLIQQCDDETHLDYWYQEEDLRGVLRKHGLKTEGNKAALIERALTLDVPETRLARGEFILYECAQAGEEKIKQSLKE